MRIWNHPRVGIDSWNIPCEDSYMTHTRKQLGRLFLDVTESMAVRGVDVAGWSLDTYSPGDGWTRYYITAEHGSTHPMGEGYRTLAGMWDFLYGVKMTLCVLPA